MLLRSEIAFNTGLLMNLPPAAMIPYFGRQDLFGRKLLPVIKQTCFGTSSVIFLFYASALYAGAL
jgi:hypothetical protein